MQRMMGHPSFDVLRDSIIETVVLSHGIIYLVGSLAIHFLIQNFHKLIREKEIAEGLLRHCEKNLDERVSEEMDKRREQEQLLIQRSKLAFMGEMIGNIAHQWRQPLNAIALVIQDLEDAYSFGEVDEKYIKNIVEESIHIIEQMSKTMDDFRDFFNPVKKKENFSVSHVVDDSLLIIGGSLKNNSIELVRKEDESVSLHGIKNDFAQVLLNLFGNAKDVLKEKDVKKRKITIEISRMDKNRASIIVEDNGGGVPMEIMDKVFEPYFTTKAESGGTGIGLYMTRLIVEKKFGGNIYVENGEEGARFVIEI